MRARLELARLRRIAAPMLAASGAAALLAGWCARASAPPAMAALARSGLSALLLETPLLLGGALAGTLLVAHARIGRAALPGEPNRAGRAARIGQSLSVLPACAAACAIGAAPGRLGAVGSPGPAPVQAADLVAAAVAFAASFALLVAERNLASADPDDLPEATDLRRLAFCATLATFAAGLLAIATAVGLPAAVLLAAPRLLLAGIAAELGLRALLRLYLPPPPRTEARAAVGSVLARLVLVACRAERAGAVVRDRLGLDFSRSWALGYLRAAAAPLGFALASFAWCLSGVVLVPVDGRAVYERMGAPVRVLHPGLHAILPWPLGVARPVEFGTLHEMALGDPGPAPPLAGAPPAGGAPFGTPMPFPAAGAMLPASAYGFGAAPTAPSPGILPPAPMPAYGYGGPAPPAAGAATPARALAEDPSPVEADRLWDAPHPGELTLLIASDAATAPDAGPGGARRQLFQSVSADLRVIWRVGASDRDALAATYAAVRPEALLRAVAGRVVALEFAGRTLDGALGADRESMAADLRARLQAALDRHDAGLRIVAVVIEAIHPPAGAADAYHAVRAAEIAADAAIFAERGRAITILSQSRQFEAERIADATARGAETTEGASAGAIRFAADQGAALAGGRAFLLERYLASLSAAIARSPLTIVDSRIWSDGAPTLDLRPMPGAAPTTGDGE